MVFDPKLEQVNVKRLLIYSLIPFLNIYAEWRIQKFWKIFVIRNLLGIGIGFLIGVTIALYFGDSLNDLQLEMMAQYSVMPIFLVINPLLMRHYAKKYNEKIMNGGFK